MKKIWLPLLAVLLLCACGGENDRAEELQEQYQQVSSYETDAVSYTHLTLPTIA